MLYFYSECGRYPILQGEIKAGPGARGSGKCAGPMARRSGRPAPYE